MTPSSSGATARAPKTCPHPKCGEPVNRGGRHCGRARCEKWVQRKAQADALTSLPTYDELVKKVGCRCERNPTVAWWDGETLRCLACGRVATWHRRFFLDVEERGEDFKLKPFKPVRISRTPQLASGGPKPLRSNFAGFTPPPPPAKRSAVTNPERAEVIELQPESEPTEADWRRSTARWWRSRHERSDA